MALTSTQQAELLFKVLMGKGSSDPLLDFFEESQNGRPVIFPTQIWADAASMPTTAPGGIDAQVTGVVKRFIDKVLTAVPGTSNRAYQHADLVDCIPFNFGDGSYNYSLKDSTGTAIPFGSGDWVVDPNTGTLTFYGTVPGNMPPKISFYKYVGTKGAGSGGAGGGGTAPQWFEGDAAPAPQESVDPTLFVKQREFILGDSQDLYCIVKVPAGYTTGKPIKILLPFSCIATAGTARLEAKVVWNRQGQNLSSTEVYTSTNTALTCTSGNSSTLQQATLDITSSSGQISSTNVAPGDLLRVRLHRDSSDTALSPIYAYCNTAEVTFT